MAWGPARTSIGDFSAGLHADDHPSRIPEGAASACRNVVFGRRSVRSRPGYTAHGLTPATGGVRSLGMWTPQDNGGDLRLVAAMGTALEATATAEQGFSTHTTLATTVHATNPVRFAQLGAELYFVDGDGHAKRAAFAAGAEDVVEEMANFTFEAAPTVTAYKNSSSSDYLDPGTYLFALGWYEYGKHPVAPSQLGAQVSLVVPPDTYDEIVVTLPDVEAWADWTTGDRVYIMAKTPYGPGHWTRMETIDPADAAVYGVWWQTGKGQGTSINTGTRTDTDSSTSARRAEGSHTLSVYVAACFFHAGQTVHITGTGGYFDGYYVIQSVGATEFTIYTDDTSALYWVGGPAKITVRETTFSATTSGYADEDFLPKPPKGATICCEWQNRMVYAAPAPYSTGAVNTIYISNLGDGGVCVRESVSNPPDNYGAWITIGAAGEAIRGLIAGPGSALLVLKETSTWIVDGGGPNTFSALRVAGAAGCARHETAQEVDGSILWFSGDTVFAFAGSGAPKDIAEGRVREIIKKYTAAEKAASYAAYDPIERAYTLFFPLAGDYAAAEYRADALRLDLRTGAWAPLGDLPGGAAIYAQGAATPGTYAGAGTDSAIDAVYLYRLFTGEDDNGEAIRCEWWSREMEWPDPRQYKSIERVFAQVRCPDPGQTTFRLALRTNGSERDQATSGYLDPLPGGGEPAVLRWRVPPIGDVGTFRVGVIWEGTAEVEVSRIDLEVNVRGAFL